jgi:hypothetical protein
MSMYAVMVPDSQGVMKPSTVVDDLDKALDAAATLAAKGNKPSIFKEIDADVVLTARLVPHATGAENGTSTNGHAHPARRPVVIRPAGAKRSAGDLSKLRTRILSWVMTRPGKGVEEMSQALQVPTKDLVLPIRQLVSEKKMGKKGQARAVKYFPPKQPSVTASKTQPVKKAA